MLRQTARPVIPRFGGSGNAIGGWNALTAAGFVLLAMMVPTVIAMAIDERTLNGVSVWTKPLKFEFSIAVHLLTLSVLMLLLTSEQREGVFARVVVTVILVCAAFEISYITIQAARGEASHFNSSTPFARFMYGLMGFAAVAMLAGSALLGVLILKYGGGDPPLAFAAGLGLILGSLLGGATGIYMGGQPNHWVGGLPTDADGLPIVGWSRSGGDLRVAHFVGLHMTQALPLMAWISLRVFPRPFALPAVITTAILGTVLTGAAFAQAVAGRPLLPM